MLRMKLFVGDITTLKVSVIVTAANRFLRGGGGVDGAIHDAAGPSLIEACQRMRMLDEDGTRCSTGNIKITPGFNLQCKYVFHAVGPIWDKHYGQEPQLLAACYRMAMRSADGQGSIAFPCISTGIYGFPMMLATSIALISVATAELADYPEVIFCCFNQEQAAVYDAIAKTIGLTLEKMN